MTGSILQSASADTYLLYSLLSRGQLLCSTRRTGIPFSTLAAPPTWSLSKCVTIRVSSSEIPLSSRKERISFPCPLSPVSIRTAPSSVRRRKASALPKENRCRLSPEPCADAAPWKTGRSSRRHQKSTSEAEKNRFLFMIVTKGPPERVFPSFPQDVPGSQAETGLCAGIWQNRIRPQFSRQR